MTKDEVPAFVTLLVRLADEGQRADRAAIKRARTGHPAQRIQARRVYHQLVPKGVAHTPWNVDLIERVAMLFVLDPHHIPDGPGVGTAAHRLAGRTGASEAAVVKRLMAVLAAGPETLDTHLARLFTRFESKDIGVDFVQLTKDLSAAGHPDRYVQRRWADQFWGRETPETTPETTGAAS